MEVNMKEIKYGEAKDLISKGIPVLCKISERDVQLINNVSTLDGHQILEKAGVQALFVLYKFLPDNVTVAEDVPDVEYLLSKGEKVYCINPIRGGKEEIITYKNISRYMRDIHMKKIIAYWYD